MQGRDFCDRLQKLLAARHGDIGNKSDFFRSAVLLPLVDTAEGLAVLFEVRSGNLAWQPGEICFPGGRIEASDQSALAAAVRETAEELGLAPAQIRPLGPLDWVIGQIGVLLYPFVGYLAADVADLKPNREEVAEVFTVPLVWLLAAQPQVGHMEMATRPLSDFPFHLLADYSPDWKPRITYPVWFYQYGARVIWGLTARVLKGFLDLCREMERPSENLPTNPSKICLPDR
ncbi:NUDIX hydrolase [Thermosinus carboxydivorans]|nr:CoA pyrophosphatase [Thermosinus carboxydivorans]